MKVPDLTKVSTYDNPITFIAAVILVLVPTLALLNFAFAKAGWPGPSALIRSAA